MPKAKNEENEHIFAVNFMFPELKGGGIYQSTTVKASNAGLALNRAWKEIRKHPAIRGRKITTAKITFVQSVVEKREPTTRSMFPNV